MIAVVHAGLSRAYPAFSRDEMLDLAAGFAELKRSINGISDSVLSERLAELQAAGLVIRSVDAGPPVSVSYGLSDAGSALLPALQALSHWAEQNLPDADAAS